ncbi:MAG: hypothetical protein GY801_50095 [bacterium]|nr:hypothetical protein [bacterium]
MMNFKQQEVLENIVATLQKKFADAHVVSVEDLGANSFWVTMVEPTDEEQQLEFDELQAELATDALIDYGFQFRFVPTDAKENMQKTASYRQAA